MLFTEIASLDRLQIERDGAQRFGSALPAPVVAMITNALSSSPTDQAGVRLFGSAELRPMLAATGVIGSLATGLMRRTMQPVRAVLFDKSPLTNWRLAWHQDRVIVVKERLPVDGFGPWTRKQGALHVAPPFAILSRMLTLRVHLDAVPSTNAPLLIAPGSHRFGRVSEQDVPEVVARCGAVACEADAGDVWAYSTPILHASEAAMLPKRRRVLQVDYSGDDLLGGLEWLGV
jgi:hypothetical protein